jgi:hypothetical protein
VLMLARIEIDCAEFLTVSMWEASASALFAFGQRQNQSVGRLLGLKILVEKCVLASPKVPHRWSREAVALLWIAQQSHVLPQIAETVVHFEAPQEEAPVIVSIGQKQRRRNIVQPVDG